MESLRYLVIPVDWAPGKSCQKASTRKLWLELLCSMHEACLLPHHQQGDTFTALLTLSTSSLSSKEPYGLWAAHLRQCCVYWCEHWWEPHFIAAKPQGPLPSPPVHVALGPKNCSLPAAFCDLYTHTHTHTHMHIGTNIDAHTSGRKGYSASVFPSKKGHFNFSGILKASLFSFLTGVDWGNNHPRFRAERTQ